MNDLLTTRLTAAQQQQAALLQQRARLTELLEQTVAQLNANQGRIAELTELITLSEPQTGEKVGGTD